MRSLHFSEAELRCKCGCGAADMDTRFLALIEALRVAYSKPLKVNSAYRCETWNLKCGGSENSLHMYGRAIDFEVLESTQRYRLIALAQSLGFRGIGVDKNFLHLDNRETVPVLWVYPTGKKPNLKVV